MLIRHAAVSALLFAAVVTVSRRSEADVCYELVTSIHHPATWGPACHFDLDDLQPWDALCIAAPVCCIPAVCQTVPYCWVTTLIRNASEQEFTCNITAEDAIRAWVEGFIFLNHDALAPLTNALYAAGEPLTPQMFQLLHDLGESSLTEGLDWPTDFQLSAIRVLSESDLGAQLNPLAWGIEHGRAFGNSIILSDGRYEHVFANSLPALRDFECSFDSIGSDWFDSFKTLLHEIAHTIQYRNLGDTGFYSLYVLEAGVAGDVKETGLERGAEEFEAGFEARCIAADGTCDLPGAPPSPSGEALTASEWVRVNDRAEIWTEGGEMDACGGAGRLFPCYGRARAAGQGGMYIGTNSRTGRLVSGGSVDLRDRAQVEDSVDATGQVTIGNQSLVKGEVNEMVPPPSDPFDGFSMSFPAFGPSVSLEPNQTVTLDSGSYGDLRTKPGAIVYLNGGTYYFRSFDIDVDSLLVVQDTGEPTRIHAFAWSQLKGVVEANPRNTLIAVQQGGIELSGQLNGTLLVPNGKVNIYQQAGIGAPSHHGAVAAEHIELHQDVVFVQVPFVHSWEPPPFVALPPPALTATVQITSSWTQGYCAVLNIVNSSNVPSTWSVVLSTNGSTITGSWNGTFSAPSGVVTVGTSQSWNSTVAAHSTNSSVGFCASRTAPSMVPAVVSVGN